MSTLDIRMLDISQTRFRCDYTMLNAISTMLLHQVAQ